MPDTNIIGDIQEGLIDLELVIDCHADFYMTHIQEDEIQATYNEALREKLLEVFTTVTTDIDPTESMILGISKLGRAKLGGGRIYRQLVNELPEDDGNEMKDALIAESAIQNGYVFITADQDLQKTLDNHYPDAYTTRSEFINYLETTD